MVTAILSYLWAAILASLTQIGIFLVPGLVLTLVMNYASMLMQRRALLTIGKGWYLGLFGWLGTIIHELGHAFFCLIFGHKITALKLFAPNPETGTLGYVEHAYNSSNIYQLVGNFFIGIGPILLGTAFIYLLLYLLLRINPFSYVTNVNLATPYFSSLENLTTIFQIFWTSSSRLISEIFSVNNLAIWQLYVFIYLAFAIGSCITLSPADIKGTLKGLSVILILILVFNLATIWAGDLTLTIFTGTISYLLVFYIAMFLILLMDIFVSIVLLLPLSLIRYSKN